MRLKRFSAVRQSNMTRGPTKALCGILREMTQSLFMETAWEDEKDVDKHPLNHTAIIFMKGDFFSSV